MPAATYWSVVVPVKLLHAAKTRLGITDRQQRSALAQAMALDTIEVALSCPAVEDVVIVTDESAITAAAAELGAVAVSDAPAAGLNAALIHGVTVARARRSGAAVAALAADLPALRTDELTRALLAAAGWRRAMVADASGSGTVLLTAIGVPLDPEYGDGSLARHRQAGVEVLDIDAPGLRRDVDTLADLRAAMRLGCGPRTAAVAAELLAVLESATPDTA